VDCIDNFVCAEACITRTDGHCVCRKKWNKIKKTSLSSKLKGMPRDVHLTNNNLLKIKESSTSVVLSSPGWHCVCICYRLVIHLQQIHI